MSTRSTSHSRNRSTPAKIANGIIVKTARKIQNTAAWELVPSLARPSRSPASPGMVPLTPETRGSPWVCRISVTSVITVSASAAANDSPSAHSRTLDCWRASALVARR